MSSNNSVKDTILIKFREINNEYIVNFWAKALKTINEEKHREFFQKIVESTFFDWSSNGLFSGFAWKHDVSDEEQKVAIENFNTNVKPNFTKLFQKYLTGELVEYTIDWTDDEVKDTFEKLTEAIIPCNLR